MKFLLWQINIQSPVRSNNNPPLRLLLVTSLLLAISVVFVFVWYKTVKLKSNQLNSQSIIQPTRPPTNISTPTIVFSTKQWKKYNFQDCSLQLPTEIEAFKCDENSCLSISTLLPSGIMLGSLAGGPGTMYPNQTWDDIIVELKNQGNSYTNFTGIPGVRAIWLENPKGNELPFNSPFCGVRRQGLVMQTPNEGWRSFFLCNEVVLGGKDSPILPSDQSLFLQIVSTIKVLE